MKKTLILLAMVVALMILPFLLTTAASLAARTAKRRARSRRWRRIINPGSSRYMNRRAARLRACCLPCRLAGRGGDFLHSRICEGQTAP